MSLYFDLGGKEYEFDSNKLDIEEAVFIQTELGLTIRQFTLGTEALNALAIKGLVYLAKRRAGEAVTLRDIKFDVMDLIKSFEYRQPVAQPENPTAPPITPDGSETGTTPEPGVPVISQTSPTTLEFQPTP